MLIVRSVYIPSICFVVGGLFLSVFFLGLALGCISGSSFTFITGVGGVVLLMVTPPSP